MHVNVETQMSYAVSQRANQSPTGLLKIFLAMLTVTDNNPDDNAHLCLSYIINSILTIGNQTIPSPQTEIDTAIT